MAIQSFVSQAVEDFYFGSPASRREGWAHLSKIVARKLDMLNSAHGLGDLQVPRANQLEKLKGDRVGLYSIRINKQWRITFRWTEHGPADVDIVDYH